MLLRTILLERMNVAPRGALGSAVRGRHHPQRRLDHHLLGVMLLEQHEH